MIKIHVDFIKFTIVFWGVNIAFLNCIQDVLAFQTICFNFLYAIDMCAID